MLGHGCGLLEEGCGGGGVDPSGAAGVIEDGQGVQVARPGGGIDDVDEGHPLLVGVAAEKGDADVGPGDLGDVGCGVTDVEHGGDHPVDADAFSFGDAEVPEGVCEGAVPTLRRVGEDVVRGDTADEATWRGCGEGGADVLDEDRSSPVPISVDERVDKDLANRKRWDRWDLALYQLDRWCQGRPYDVACAMHDGIAGGDNLLDQDKLLESGETACVDAVGAVAPVLVRSRRW